MEMRKYLLLIAPTVLVIGFLFFSMSCSGPAAVSQEEEPSQQEEQQESSISEEELEQLEEAVAEEEVDTTDYKNITAGAELYGYMPSYLCTDTGNYIKIRVTNTSDFTWRYRGENRVRVGYHYYGQDVDFVDYDKTPRTPFTKNIEPGETAEVEVLINDITNPGTYVVQIDLVLEGHFWFSSKDIPMIEGKVYFNSCLEDRDQ